MTTSPGNSTRPRPLASPENQASTGFFSDIGTGSLTAPKNLAVIAIVVLVMLMWISSSMKTSYDFRQAIAEEKRISAQLETEITQLSAEQERFNDPAYIAEQARIRFDAVFPGESPIRVGSGTEDVQRQRDEESRALANIWYVKIWRSVAAEPTDPVDNT